MAKAPRRRSDRDSDRPERRGARRERRGEDATPPPVAPVRPAQPVQPVRPVRPAAVPPVAPPVRPVAPPVKPVAPVAPAVPPARPVAPAPAARPTAPAPASSSRRGAREEEVSRPSRTARPTRGGGMGLGMKVSLLTGLAALLAIAAAVFVGGESGLDDQTALDRAGYAAVQALANTDAAWWTGGGGGNRVEDAQKVVIALFGDEGREWWDVTRGRVVEPNYDEMDAGERQAAQEARERYLENEARLKGGGGGGDGPSKDAQVALANMVRNATDPGSGFRILGAWIREAKPDGSEGDYVAWSADPTNMVYTFSDTSRRRLEGKIGGSPVAVYYFGMGKPSPKSNPLRAYVAIWSGGSSGSGGGAGGLGILMLILGPLVVGGIGGMIASTHVKGTRDLAREIDRLGKSGDATRTLHAKGGEAGELARAVERMVQNLEFRSKHGDQDLDQIVDRERKVAEEIHGQLMGKNPPRLADYEVETLFKPGFEIGGDHFDYFEIDEDHVGVILLDTNVRGIPAALVMSQAKAYVRAAAPGVTSPAEVLRRVNRNLAGDLPPGRHVTALYVVLDRRAGKATVASAGHLPLLVYRHATSKLAKVNPEGIALGLDVGPVFDRSLQEGDLPIEVGDRIVLYTDGALRVMSAEGEEFGESRFYQAVAREAPKNSQAFVNFVGSAIDQFHLEAPQNDDVTISTVKRLK